VGGLPARSREVGQSFFRIGPSQPEEEHPLQQARLSHPGRVLHF